MSSSTEEESNSRGITLVSENLNSFAALKKGGSGGNLRRTRQRVDAGEPRNSYACIPNFSSRPTSQQLLVPSSVGGFAAGGINGDVIGYNVTGSRMLSSPPLGTKVSLLANSESGDSDNSGDYQRQSDEFISNGSMKDINNQPIDHSLTTSEDKSALLREILQSGNNNNNNKETMSKSNLISHLLHHTNSLNGNDDDEDEDGDGSENYAEEDLEVRSKNSACNLTVMCDEDEEDEDRREVSEEYEGGDEDEEIEDDDDIDRKDKPSRKNSSAQFRNDGQLNGEMMEEATTPLSQTMSNDDDDEDVEEEDEERKSHLRVKSPISNESKISISASSSDLGGGISSIATVMNNNASTADIKRARVENIISSISGISPSRVSSNDTTVQPVNGCKKRKLYQPQQHEASRTSFRHEMSDYEDVEMIDTHKRLRNSHNNGDMVATSAAHGSAIDDYLNAKRAKLSIGGQEFWKEQVSEMQAQIAAIQKKLTDLYDVRSPDNDSPATTSVTTSSVGAEAIKDIVNGKVQIGSKSNGRPLSLASNLNNNHNLLLQLGYLNNPDHRSRMASKSPIVNDVLDPIHFIDEARRLVHEQERLAKMEASSTTPANSVHQLLTSTPAEPKVAATAAVATASCHQPGSSQCNRVTSPDWEVLADNLKAGMSTLIDDWVRRCSSSASTIAAKNRNNTVINNTNNINTAQELSSSSSLHSNRNPIVNMSDSLKELATANQHHQLHHHQHSGSNTTSPSVMISTSTGALGSGGSLHLSDRRSPRTKVIDRGRQGGSSSTGGGSITSGLSPSANVMAATAAALMSSSNHNFGDFHALKPPTLFPHPIQIPPPPPLPTSQQSSKALSSLYVGHQSQLPFYGHLAAAAAAAAAAASAVNGNGGHGGDDMCSESQEQSGPLSLVVTPKKKRSKVTDKVPARALNRQFIQTDGMESTGGSGKMLLGGGGRGSPMDYHHNSTSIVPVSLPTSVAIPNPSLVHQSDIFSPYPYYHPAPPPLPHAPPSLSQSTRGIRTGTRSPSPSESANDDIIYSRHSHQGLRSSLLAMHGGGGGNTSPDLMNLKENGGDSSECNSNDMSYDGIIPTISFSKMLFNLKILLHITFRFNISLN
ncbi:hypothetical protein CHUAL_004330 [Chamberlinius hualienensis]